MESEFWKTLPEEIAYKAITNSISMPYLGKLSKIAPYGLHESHYIDLGKMKRAVPVVKLIDKDYYVVALISSTSWGDNLQKIKDKSVIICYNQKSVNGTLNAHLQSKKEEKKLGQQPKKLRWIAVHKSIITYLIYESSFATEQKYLF